MSLAWHVAALQRTKKLPNIKKLLAKAPSPRPQTWQEIQAVMGQWVAHTARIARQKKLLRAKNP